MTTDEFIAMQTTFIAENGFAGYLPTMVVETRREIRIEVLADVPLDVDVESFAKSWASQVAKRKQDYFLAFKVDDEHFKVVSRHGGVTDERLVTVAAT